MAKSSLFIAKLKRQLAPHLPLFSQLIAGLLLLVAVTFLIKSLPFLVNRLKSLAPAHRTALSFIQNPETILHTTNRRTNVLLLGKGGAGHEAPDLTDTIIFLSYSHAGGSATMISLPRDLWVDSLKAKLNTAYYYGNLKKDRGGLILARAAVEEIIGQPVHYTVVIDFTGFQQAIDLVGGIDIEVKRTFDDYKYPIPGKEDAQPESTRYQHLHFDAGLQTMDGDTALKFVRSRNAEGEEGTDFARANRQQQILLALQKKTLSTKVLLNPTKVSRLIAILNQSIDTDITDGDYTGFIKLALGFDRGKLQTVTLDQGEEDQPGLLVNPPTKDYSGQWVLIGTGGSWQEVQKYLTDLLSLN